MRDLHWDIRWPQRIVVLLCALDAAIAFMTKGQLRPVDPLARFGDHLLLMFLLLWGGYFDR